jgi:hypothetical protein
MQEGLTKNWTKKMHRRGAFDGWVVIGFQYESQDGEIAWHITAWPMADPIHDFWISGREFYEVSIHYFYQMTNRTLIEIFEPIKNLDAKEREAVLKAIDEWDKPESGE